ncbi:hypothetical protein H5410_053735 [Solanum commersonii]|uniref:Uncharacterized protein n=1 Tax=Solanum commersonii TaxID=4109 RepID=A0A9J5X768_SOLCO|nr:hypothetical protein H5410_053735 [Solanum commersonii]
MRKTSSNFMKCNVPSRSCMIFLIRRGGGQPLHGIGANQLWMVNDFGCNILAYRNKLGTITTGKKRKNSFFKYSFLNFSRDHLSFSKGKDEQRGLRIGKLFSSQGAEAGFPKCYNVTSEPPL